MVQSRRSLLNPFVSGLSQESVLSATKSSWLYTTIYIYRDILLCTPLLTAVPRFASALTPDEWRRN